MLPMIPGAQRKQMFGCPGLLHISGSFDLLAPESSRAGSRRRSIRIHAAWAVSVTTDPKYLVTICKLFGRLYALCAPCLLGLVAFQYKHDMCLGSNALPPDSRGHCCFLRTLSAVSLWDLLYDFDFLLWALHAFHTSVFFLTCCAMAYIYGLRLSPALDEKGLTHPSDKFWRSSGSWPLGGVCLCLALIVLRAARVAMDCCRPAGAS